MAKTMEPQILTCRVCGEEFVLTPDAREFLEQRGMVGLPKWCRSCFVQLKRSRRELRRKLATQ